MCQDRDEMYAPEQTAYIATRKQLKTANDTKFLAIPVIFDRRIYDQSNLRSRQSNDNIA